MKKKFLKILALSSLMITAGGAVAYDFMNNRSDVQMVQAAEGEIKKIDRIYNFNSNTDLTANWTKEEVTGVTATIDTSTKFGDNNSLKVNYTKSSKQVTLTTIESFNDVLGVSFDFMTNNTSNPTLTISLVDGSTTTTLMGNRKSPSNFKNFAKIYNYGTQTEANVATNTRYTVVMNMPTSTSALKGKLKFEIRSGSANISFYLGSVKITTKAPIVKHNVTFKNGETTAHAEEVNENEFVKTVPTVTVERGKKFEGWYLSTDTSETVLNEETIKAKPVTEDTEYIAKITSLQPYDVKFYNGETLINDGEYTYYEDENINVPSIVDVPDGKKFGGWQYTDATTNQTAVISTEELQSVLAQNACKEYFVKWEEAKKINISFDLNYENPTATIPNQTIDEGKKATTPSDPTRIGYRFEGWYDNKDCTGEKIDFSTYIVDSEKTFYAHWIEQITVEFDANLAGVNNPVSQTIDINGALKEIPTLTSSTGETFLGWYDKDGNLVTSTTVFASDTKLKAKWNYVRSSEANAKLGISGIGTAEKLVQYVGYREMNSIDEILPTEVGKKGKSFTLANNAAAEQIIGNFKYNDGVTNGYYEQLSPTKDSEYIKDTNVLEMQFELVDVDTYAIFIPQKASGQEPGPVYLVANSDTRLEFTSTIDKSNTSHLWTVTLETDGIKITSKGTKKSDKYPDTIVKSVLYYRLRNEPNSDNSLQERFNIYESRDEKTYNYSLPQVFVKEVYDKGETAIDYSFDNSKAMLQFKADVSKKYIDSFEAKPTEVLGTLEVGITINGETRKKTHELKYNSIKDKLIASSVDSNYYEIIYILTDISGENLYNASISATFEFDGNTATREISVSELTNLYNSNPDSYGLDAVQKDIVNGYSNYITNLKSGN